MLFVYIVIGLALIFYIRFFIIRSLADRSALTGTFFAAIKAIYFVPLFIQGLLLIWFSVQNFRGICQGFFLVFNYWRLKNEPEPDYNFLYLVSYLAIASLMLGAHAVTGRLSLDKNADPLTFFWKLVYVWASYFLLKLAYANAGLFHPLDPLQGTIYFYNDAYVILIAALLYVLLLLQFFFFKPVATRLRYLQVAALPAALYISVCLSLTLLLFLFYLLIRLLT